MSVSRSGSLFGRLLLLFTIVPIVELALLVWVGNRIGFWPTVGLIAATALLGTWMAQREGVAAWSRFQARIASGQLPGKELTDGILILIAGAFLLTPGVLTDLVGFAALFPPTRALLRRQLSKRIQRRAMGGFASFGAMPFGGGAMDGPAGVFGEGGSYAPPPASQDDAVDVPFVEYERERLRYPPPGSP